MNFENIKKNDSFVRLGGNSLSALIACRKVREAMRKRRSFLGENDENDDDGYENEEEKEPGVKKSEAGALLAPENIDNNDGDDDEEQENSTVRRLCGAFLGVDGEGPLAPCELFRRPTLASYCAFLRANFVGLHSKLASCVMGVIIR